MNSLFLPFQSAYRSFHSTESTLLIDPQWRSTMTSFPPSTKVKSLLSYFLISVDHYILLSRLKNWFGFEDSCLSWFSSYLNLLKQAVSLKDIISSYSTLSCGVPQGSVLGPLLFTLYTTPLGSVISRNSLNYHLYADDTQLYISFKPAGFHQSSETLSSAFSDIVSWTHNNKLMLNLSKTELLLIGTSQQRKKLSNVTSISLGNTTIPVSTSARNLLGFIFDSDMSLTSQVNLVCKSSHFHIRDIRHIRNLIPLSIAITLANSLVSSRLDYCNSLYSGMSKQNIQKLQRVQNSLARAITQTSKYQHITPVLKDLHWLPITQRIEYKISLLTFKTIMNGQPSYLHQYRIPQTHYSSTRSSQTSALFIPKTRHRLVSARSLLLLQGYGTHCLLLYAQQPPFLLSDLNSKLTSSKLPSLPRLFSLLPDWYYGLMHWVIHVMGAIEWYFIHIRYGAIEVQ